MKEETDETVETSTPALSAEEQAAADELAAFEGAIEEKSSPQSTPDPVEDKTVIAEEPTESSVEVPPVVQEPAASVGVTQEQLAQLIATSGSVKELTDGLKKLRDDAFGKIGGIERLIKQAEKVSTAETGLDLTLTDEDFKEVDEEVPMLTKPLRTLVNKIVKQAKVKVPTSDAIDVEALRTQFYQEMEAKIQERELQQERRLEEKLLTDRYPDWKETVANDGFKAWLANEDKETPGYQRTFMESWSAREIGGVLKKFAKHQEALDKAKNTPPQKPKAQQPSHSRVERLKEAIPPKANSLTPKPKGPLTEEEAFDMVG